MEAAVQRARQLDTQPREHMSIPQAETWHDEPPWPVPARILFMLAAGSACWAVPALFVYLLIF
jgi:hypothetical protein